MTGAPRGLLLQLSERTSAKGNPVWEVFVSTPEPRPEQQPKPEAGQDAPAKPSARPQERGDGWRGSRYRRPANGAQRAPAADGGASRELAEDGVDDLYR